jgi:hypothetical protein
MSPFPLEYLRHILDETEYLLEAAEGLSKEAFFTDATLKRAFVRSIEIIGEAAKKIPGDLKKRYYHFDWGTSTCLDNAEADIASGPVSFCIIVFLNISEYCMSPSAAPKINFVEKYLAVTDGEAPGGFPIGDLVGQK